jgi:hypothetical protein
MSITNKEEALKALQEPCDGDGAGWVSTRDDGTPVIDSDGTVCLDGDFSKKELLALIFFMEEAEKAKA